MIGKMSTGNMGETLLPQDTFSRNQKVHRDCFYPLYHSTKLPSYSSSLKSECRAVRCWLRLPNISVPTLRKLNVLSYERKKFADFRQGLLSALPALYELAAFPAWWNSLSHRAEPAQLTVPSVVCLTTFVRPPCAAHPGG